MSSFISPVLALWSSFILVVGQPYTCSDLVYDSDGWRLCKIFENIQYMPSYWLNTTDVCDWHIVSPTYPSIIREGVECSNGDVTLVDFCYYTSESQGSLNLTVPWPSKVEEVTLSGCDFDNSITDVNFSIFPSSLRRLYIRSTDMTGTLDLCTMKHLINLQTLWIFNNEFSGSIDFSCLTELENLNTLSLDSQDWSGSYNLSALPTSITYLEFEDMPNLDVQPFPDLSKFSFSTLRLRELNMQGTINPNFIPQRAGVCDLSYNSLSGTIRFSDWPSLSFLQLDSNLFSGTLDWENSGRFSYSIELQNNRFSGIINTSFLNNGLRDINLENNDFVGPIDFTPFSSELEATIDTDVFCDAQVYCAANERSISRSTRSCEGANECAATCRCEPNPFTSSPTVGPSVMPSISPTTTSCFSRLRSCIDICEEEPCDEAAGCVGQCRRAFGRCYSNEVTC